MVSSTSVLTSTSLQNYNFDPIRLARSRIPRNPSIWNVRRLSVSRGYALAILIDTQSEVTFIVTDLAGKCADFAVRPDSRSRRRD